MNLFPMGFFFLLFSIMQRRGVIALLQADSQAETRVN